MLAHAYVPDAIRQAARAGVRSIEHGNLIDAEAARVMAEHGCYLVPTLVVYARSPSSGDSSTSPQRASRIDTVLNAGLSAIETALAAGVKVGFGTDLLGETHDAQSKELQLRSRAQSPIEVIRAATTVNAELLRRPNELGVVAPGAFADLLVVEGDPLTDLSVLTGQGDRLAVIARAGEIIKNQLAYQVLAAPARSPARGRGLSRIRNGYDKLKSIARWCGHPRTV